MQIKNNGCYFYFFASKNWAGIDSFLFCSKYAIIGNPQGGVEDGRKPEAFEKGRGNKGSQGAEPDDD